MAQLLLKRKTMKQVDLNDIPVQSPNEVISTITSMIGLAMENVGIAKGYDPFNLFTNIQLLTFTDTNTNEMLARYVIVLN